MIGLLLSALDPFKMILLWGLKKIPLLLEIPALKDHLSAVGGSAQGGLDPRARGADRGVREMVLFQVHAEVVCRARLAAFPIGAYVVPGEARGYARHRASR